MRNWDGTIINIGACLSLNQILNSGDQPVIVRFWRQNCLFNHRWYLLDAPLELALKFGRYIRLSCLWSLDRNIRKGFRNLHWESERTQDEPRRWEEGQHARPTQVDDRQTSRSNYHIVENEGRDQSQIWHNELNINPGRSQLQVSNFDPHRDRILCWNLRACLFVRYFVKEIPWGG